VENQNLYALTSGDRYTSGFSHGEQQAVIDFQNNIAFNPVCVEHTGYYCAGYFKGYNVTWNNLAAKWQTSNPSPNPPASNSTSPVPPASNTNTTAVNPPYYSLYYLCDDHGDGKCRKCGGGSLGSLYGKTVNLRCHLFLCYYTS
jgi:hypothetical protein